MFVERRKMAISNVSYLTINRILEKLGDQPEDGMIRLSIDRIISIVRSDKDSINSGTACWEGLDYDYLLDSLNEIKTSDKVPSDKLIALKADLIYERIIKKPHNPYAGLEQVIVSSVQQLTPMIVNIFNRLESMPSSNRQLRLIHPPDNFKSLNSDTPEELRQIDLDSSE